MDELLAARLQMAFSLGWHIIFACIGMAMPFLMAYAEYRWIRTENKVYLVLAKSWSKGVAIFFAVGAVSGTLLSFELGLLWPGFMEHAGAIIGMPFSLEGTAFFLEAIALGVFLYGWDRIPKWAHWWSGVMVGISGVVSGIFVVSANSWMNSPEGFTYENGVFSNIDPVDAMFNAAWFTQSLHMTFAAFTATGFAVAGVHALLWLRGHRLEFHQKAIEISMVLGTIGALIMPLSGDLAAKDVAKRQPAKLAAMEAHFHTEESADLIVGGWPDEESETVDYAIRIPGALSFLAHGDFHSEVIGLDQIPDDEQPPVLITHMAFQIMIFLGSILALMGLIHLFFLWKGSMITEKTWFLKALSLLIPAGFIAVEAGWTVTEVGRQPWVIYGIMKTADAVTPMPGIQISFFIILAVYTFLTVVVLWLMKRQINSIHQQYKTQ